MKYALLIYEDETAYGAEDSPEMQAIIAQHGAFVGALGSAYSSGAGLSPSVSATTVRQPASGAPRTVHDGPFAESREQLGGFYIIDVPDLDAAIAWARKLPMAAKGAVEIRPLMTDDA